MKIKLFSLLIVCFFVLTLSKDVDAYSVTYLSWGNEQETNRDLYVDEDGYGTAYYSSTLASGNYKLSHITPQGLAAFVKYDYEGIHRNAYPSPISFASQNDVIKNLFNGDYHYVVCPDDWSSDRLITFYSKRPGITLEERSDRSRYDIKGLNVGEKIVTVTANRNNMSTWIVEEIEVSSSTYYLEENITFYTQELIDNYMDRIIEPNATYFFQMPPQPILVEKLAGANLGGVMAQVKLLIPIIVVFLVGLIGFYKALRVVRNLLYQA